jgi:hypothetical protein
VPDRSAAVRIRVCVFKTVIAKEPNPLESEKPARP